MSAEKFASGIALTRANPDLMNNRNEFPFLGFIVALIWLRFFFASATSGLEVSVISDVEWVASDNLSVAHFMFDCVYHSLYRVFLKKVLHKREEKMQEKLKMTQQKDENLYNNNEVFIFA